jgi:hypothetical protein
MRKLTLDVDALAVETFAAGLPREDAGTVPGAEASGQRCSAVDACPSGRGCTTISPC